jgi:hypothetical protein
MKRALLLIALLAACAVPTAPVDPCAQPPAKGCTPPSCAHPMCY